MAHRQQDVHLSTRAAFLMGVAAALSGGAISAALAREARPVALAAIKQGLLIRDNARARVAELREDLEDLVAQAGHEYRSERGAEQGEISPGGI